MDRSSDFIPRLARVAAAPLSAHGPLSAGGCTVLPWLGLHGAAVAGSEWSAEGAGLMDDFSRSAVPQKYFQDTNRLPGPMAPKQYYSLIPASKHVPMLPSPSAVCHHSLSLLRERTAAA